MKIKFRPKYQGAGPVGVQDINWNSIPESMQGSLDTLFSVNGMPRQHIQGLENGTYSYQTDNPVDLIQNGLSIAGDSSISDLLPKGDFQGYWDSLQNPTRTNTQQAGSTGSQTDTQNGTQGGSQKSTQGGGENDPLDGNTLNPMSMPYFMPDLTSRAQMMGRAIGNIRTAKETKNAGLGTVGVLGTVASGLSLGMGLAREIAGASSEQYAAARDFREQQRRLAEERKNAMITYQRGGGINIGNGQRVDTSSLIGEYIYPLPKSMEENANVEIEKGEYALTPDVVGPMEAKGEKHSKGGTPVSLPEAYIISDYRKIPEDFAASIRETYGIKASPKDSYASLIDKYKSKIGLKKKYEEQEKAIARLEKNQSVKDTNTSALNKSILSKYINDNQKEIDDLETELRDFAEMVYKRQEDDKREEEMKFFFRDGGQFKPSMLKKTAKALGLSIDDTKRQIFDTYKKRTKMPGGGDTELAKRQSELLRRVFNGPISMGVVEVEGLGDLLNPNSDATQNQGLQHIGQYGYGRANENSVTNLLNVNRWARGLNENGNFTDNTLKFQQQYYNRLNQIRALADAGLFSNADAARQFVTDYNFYGQDSRGNSTGQRPSPNDNGSYYSNAQDGLPGQTTLSKAYISMNVVTPDELKKLNDADIRNYVDIRNNPEQAKKILGENSAAWKAFNEMNNSEDFSDFDFVLGAQREQTAPLEAPVPQLPVNQNLPEPGYINGPPAETLTVEEPDVTVPSADEVLSQNPPPKQPEERTRRGNIGAGLIFPEILRDRQNGLIVEGLERHYAPRVDPVLRSADQYINELNRATSSQLDAMGDVPDSQRAAIMANMNAIAGSNIARYINEVDYFNTQQRNEADRFNQMNFRATQDANIQERQRYEAGTLQAMAIYDENRARYLDNLNQEAQQKFNTQTTINTLQSAFPNMRITPNGSIVYDDNGQPVLMGGDWSTRYLMAMAAAQQQNNRRKNGTTSTTSATATGGASR